MTWHGQVSESHVHVARTKFPPVESYISDMKTLGIKRAVLSQNIGNLDNEYLIETTQVNPDLFRAILMFDYDREETAAEIRRYSREPNVVGARLFAETGAKSDQPLSIWRSIYENDWVASVRGPLSAIRANHFKLILREFPDLRIRIEHLGSFLYDRDGEVEFQTLLELADLPNVYLMWAGFFANSSREFPYLDTQEYLRRLLSAFGSERIMWSGDWNAKVSEGDLEMCQNSMRLFTSRLLLPEITDLQLENLMNSTLTRFLRW